ncbi:MAG: hypothetical protein ACO1SX_14725 [Actinomycetota bacterium]
MKTPHRWMFPFLTLQIASLALPANAAAAAPRPCVGWVQEIRGTAYWRSQPSAPRVTLQPKADQYRGLRTGEQVLCPRGGHLRLMLNGRLREVKPAEGWLTVPPPLRPTGLTERALEAYGRRLGAERAAGSALYCPADGGRVRASVLVVRWQPDPAWKLVTLSLRDEAGQELWRRPRVEAAAGKLEDAELRTQLGQQREGTLELLLSSPDGASQSVRFTLLPARETPALLAELAGFEKGPGLLPRIGRAQCLIQRRLYNEAADEYEGALAQAPESRALLEKTLQIQRLIGNLPRAEELEQRLVWGTK